MRRIFGVFKAIPAARFAVPFRPSYMTMAKFRPMPPSLFPPMSGFRLMSTNFEDETTEPSDPNEHLEDKVDIIRGLLASPDSSKEELLKAQLLFRSLAPDLVDEGVWEDYIGVGNRLRQHSIGIDDLLELLYTGTRLLRRSQPRNRGPARRLLRTWVPWLQATLADSGLLLASSLLLFLPFFLLFCPPTPEPPARPVCCLLLFPLNLLLPFLPPSSFPLPNQFFLHPLLKKI